MRRWLWTIGVVAACGPKVSEAPDAAGAASDAPVVIEKSPLDHREMATFLLPNGMRAVVVSDPEADMAAAAVDVHIGQFSDPPDREGLAHFLEHMLFMGTEKYPEEGAYRKYVQDHGGRTNAGTGQTHTGYHFQVAHDALEPALDRFAQFFIAPTLDPAYVDRERNAVHAEYKLKVKDDVRRIREVRRATSHPDHPFAKFSVGNQTTLADREGAPVYADLRTLYDDAYSASRMVVSIVGREDVGTLTEMVASRFSQVRTDGKPKVHTTEPPFRDDQLGTWVHIVPLAEQRTLTLEFLIPAVGPMYRDKSVSLLTGMLGDEGPGSLHAYLKGQGWTEWLSAGTDGADDHGLLTIGIGLTPEGLEAREDAIDAVFAYTERIREGGVTEARYEERARIAQLRFQSSEPGDPRNTAIGMARQAHHVAPEHLLSSGYLWEGLDVARVRDLLDRIRPDNMRARLVAEGLTTDAVEPRYDVAYGLVPFTDAQMARWTSPPTLDALALPPANPYVAEDLSLVADDGGTVPVHVVDTPTLDVWHLQDGSFETPKGVVKLRLFYDLSEADDAHRVLNSVYVSMLDDRLEPFVYPVREAGIGLGVGSSGRGLTVSLSGFNDKHAVLLRDVLARIRDAEFSEDRFEAVKERLLRRWRNEVHARPINQTVGALSESLSPARLPAEVRIATLEPLTLSGLSTFVARAHETGAARMLVHGNHDAEAVQAMVDAVQATWLDGKAGASMGDIVTHLLPEGAHLRRDVRIDHDDSTIVVYLQGRADSVEARAGYALLGQLVRTPFFDQLRTQQQLGYVVSAGYSRFDTVPGLRAVIQSARFGPKVLEDRIDAFFTAFRNDLVAMDDASFETVKEGLVAQLLKREARMSDRAGRLWSELASGETGFDTRERSAEAVRALSKDAVIALWDATVLSEGRRRLDVRSTGHAHGEERPEVAGCEAVRCFEGGWEGMNVRAR